MRAKAAPAIVKALAHVHAGRDPSIALEWVRKLPGLDQRACGLLGITLAMSETHRQKGDNAEIRGQHTICRLPGVAVAR